MNNAINSSVHSAIRMAPDDVNEKNSRLLAKRIEAARLRKKRKLSKSAKLRVGDLVRIPIDKKVKFRFRKGSTANWTKELFKIVKISQGTYVPVYTLVDASGAQLKLRYYEKELNFVRSVINKDE